MQVAVVAGDDRLHAFERASPGHVESDDFSVAHRASENASDQCARMIQIGGVSCAAGDLLDPVYQRNAATAEAALCNWFSSHELVSAADLTDSMTFT